MIGEKVKQAIDHANITSEGTSTVAMQISEPEASSRKISCMKQSDNNRHLQLPGELNTDLHGDELVVTYGCQ
jgi:hypothetical protein